VSRLFLFSLDHTQAHTPQSVGLLWTRDRPVAETSTWQHKHSQATNVHASGGIRSQIPSSAWPQTYALDSAATGISVLRVVVHKIRRTTTIPLAFHYNRRTCQRQLTHDVTINYLMVDYSLKIQHLRTWIRNCSNHMLNTPFLSMLKFPQLLFSCFSCVICRRLTWYVELLSRKISVIIFASRRSNEFST
jgi:hypothetical protein